MPLERQPPIPKTNILKMATAMWSFLRHAMKVYFMLLTRGRATYPFPAICGMIATVPVMVLSLWVLALALMKNTRK